MCLPRSNRFRSEYDKDTTHESLWMICEKPPHIPSPLLSQVFDNDVNIMSYFCSDSQFVSRYIQDMDTKNNFPIRVVGFIFMQTPGKGSSLNIASKARGLYCWGYNEYGNLGVRSTISDEHSPLYVSYFQKIPIKIVACGAHHNFVVTGMFSRYPKILTQPRRWTPICLGIQ